MLLALARSVTFPRALIRWLSFIEQTVVPSYAVTQQNDHRVLELTLL
jgi:hypothetical protein